MNSSQIVVLAGICVFGVVVYFIYDHWRSAYTLRRAHQKIERLRREEEAGVPPSPTDYHYVIAVNSEGITVSNLRRRSDQPAPIHWAEISRVTVFKRDLWSTDCICLYLARKNDSGIELNEEMARWRTFLDALPKYLPGCRTSDNWFASVAFPAFAANSTEIYSRANHQTA